MCREQSVGKLDPFKDRITVIPGRTDDREVIERAVEGCGGVLVVLVPRGVHGYATGTAQAVLDYSPPGARLVFSSGWHITRDGRDVYSWKLKAIVKIGGPLGRLARFADLDDQVEACRRVFESDTRWTVVRGSDLELLVQGKRSSTHLRRRDRCRASRRRDRCRTSRTRRGMDDQRRAMRTMSDSLADAAKRANTVQAARSDHHEVRSD